MRHGVWTYVASALLTGLLSTTVLGGELQKPSAFQEPRLGLGAAIPDDLLFGSDGDETAEIIHTFRRPPSKEKRGKPKQRSLKPILDGWDVKAIEVAPRQATAEPVQPGCYSQSVIFARLGNDGWREFTRLSMRPRTIAFTARRHTSAFKRVQVDRCSGEVIHISAAYVQ